MIAMSRCLSRLATAPELAPMTCATCAEGDLHRGPIEIIMPSSLVMCRGRFCHSTDGRNKTNGLQTNWRLPPLDKRIIKARSNDCLCVKTSPDAYQAEIV